jgi:hypothetical protein
VRGVRPIWVRSAPVGSRSIETTHSSGLRGQGSPDRGEQPAGVVVVVARIGLRPWSSFAAFATQRTPNASSSMSFAAPGTAFAGNCTTRGQRRSRAHRRLRHRPHQLALVLVATTSTIVASGNLIDVAAYSSCASRFGPRASPSPPMQIRIVKKPPAPRMDGWDVSRFGIDQTHDVEPGIGKYLIMAGYAVLVHDTATENKYRRNEPA